LDQGTGPLEGDSVLLGREKMEASELPPYVSVLEPRRGEKDLLLRRKLVGNS